MALARLSKAGTIRRLARGLYDYPKKHPKLGPLSPTPEAVARAVSEAENTRIQPSGAYAVNLLGLSMQVPSQVVFLTDGMQKTVTFGDGLEPGLQQIEFRRTTPKNMATAGTTSGLVIQAFRYLKRDGVTSSHVERLRRTLSAKDRKRLWKDRVYTPAWMHPHFEEIAGDPFDL